MLSYIACNSLIHRQQLQYVYIFYIFRSACLKIAMFLLLIGSTNKLIVNSSDRVLGILFYVIFNWLKKIYMYLLLTLDSCSDPIN